MSQPLTDSAKAGAGAVLAVILAGLAGSGGAYLVASGGWTQSEAAAGHVVVGWGDVGAAPAGAVVLHATARVSDATAAAFGVVPSSSACSAATLPDGGDEHCDYFFCNVTALRLDGGSDPGPNFIPGATIVFDAEQVDSPAPAGAPMFECFREGRPDAPFTCACAVDATCLQPDGGAAPAGITLQPGAFTPGAGCLPKACIELAGSSSWDSRCPQ